MTGKGLREDRKERDHGGFPLLLFRFLIKAFRNDGYGGDCGVQKRRDKGGLLLFLPPPLAGGTKGGGF